MACRVPVLPLVGVVVLWVALFLKRTRLTQQAFERASAAAASGNPRGSVACSTDVDDADHARCDDECSAVLQTGAFGGRVLVRKGDRVCGADVYSEGQTLFGPIVERA